MPLDYILRKCKEDYKFSQLQEKLKHLVYTDDISIFAKKEKEVETSKQTIWNKCTFFFK